MLSPLRGLLVVVSCLFAIASLATVSVAQLCPAGTPCVTTWHNDNNRTGWQQAETALKPSTVSQTSFGLLWQWGSPAKPLAGSIYAQPLAVTLSQTVGTCVYPCSLVFVATEQDMLYAFNATSSSQSPVWSLSLGTAVYCANPPSNFMICNDSGSSIVGPYIGVTGTPVIDTSTNTLYALAAVEIPTNAPPPPLASYVLFAVDITTGAVKASTTISGSVPGLAPSALCGTSSGQGTVTFDVNHLQRPALLLLNGVVYVGFAAGPVDDVGERNNGWLFGYKLSGGSFTPTAIFNTTPNGTGGGIWQSGAGPASDGSYIYLATGNGTFDRAGVQNPSIDYGDTLLQLNPSDLTVHDYYTPYDVFNYPPPNGTGLCLDMADEDFGSGGVLVPPSPFTYNGKNVVVNADKQSNLYVANQHGLGGFQAGQDCVSNLNNIECVQTPSPLQDAKQGYWSSPAYWYDGSTHYWLYYAPTSDTATANPYAINAYELATIGESGPISQTPSARTSILFCQHSPTPSGSWNGNDPTTGIVWAIENQNTGNPGSGTPACSGEGYTLPAALHAFNATNLLQELYTTRPPHLQTAIGSFTTFSTPTIFKGQVYMGTQTEVDVFGLCGSPSVCKP
jgi:hypothetical protein